ncbi:MAG: T9SS type A sorting domain-containing protein [Bacteroidota bacterium]
MAKQHLGGSFFLALLFLFFFLSTQAQNITKIEYFIDGDPGYDNGINVPITPAALLEDLTFSVPVITISDGFHTLSIRAKDENGVWSFVQQSTIYKIPASSVSGTLSNISQLEYFIDADPGYGSGTQLPVTAATTLNDLTFSVPVSGIAEGFHTFSIRAKDANGAWSFVQQSTIYKIPAASIPGPLANVVYLEYFIDTDPGYGNGIEVSITPATRIEDIMLTLDVSSLSEETHVLQVRARDANGVWSFNQAATFEVCNGEVPVLAVPANVSSSGFTANWNVVSGATSYLLDVSNDNFETYISGYEAREVFINAETISGLEQGTSYQFRVRSVITCASLFSNVQTAELPVAEPTAQPTNLQFANPTTSGFQVTFSAASGSPTGYLVLRRLGTSPVALPELNTTYNVGDMVGNSIVAFRGGGLGFVETGLPADTEYYYDVFSFNSIGSLVTYKTVSPLEGNFYTVAEEPVSQPTNLSFGNITSESVDVSFTPSSPSVSGYLVLRRLGNPPSFTPVDGVDYAVGSNQGDAQVAYAGSENSFTDTGLDELTTYHYGIYAFNGAAQRINYLTANTPVGNVTTALSEPEAQPTNLVFSNITSSSVRLSFTPSTSSPSGYLVVRKQGSSSSFVPVTNTSYSSGQDLGDGSFVAYVGPLSGFDDMDLNASTEYFYDIFSFNQSGSLFSYRVNNPLEGNVLTFTGEPSDQPTSIVFSEITSMGWRISFTEPTPAPENYLILRKQTDPSSAIPQDGQGYTVGQNIGDAEVVYIGDELSFIDSGLDPGTVYHYSFFSFNGAGSAANYVNSLNSTNRSSSITIPATPEATAATTIGQNSFLATWNASVGASSYRIDVSNDNFATILPNWNDVTVTGNSVLIDELLPGNIYGYRLRAANESGVSVSGNVVQQLTLPATPFISAVNNATQQGFELSWSSVTGASGYRLDVSRDNFATTEPGYDDVEVNGISITVEGLSPGLEYTARLRAENETGISPSSPVVRQLLIPSTPIALNASNTTTNFFNANWEQSTGAVTYRIDVSLATDEFNPNLEGYNDLEVNGTSQPVTGLLANTLYQYRIRAENATGISPNSNVISLTTEEQGTGVSLTLGPVTRNQVFAEGDHISLDISSGSPPYTVNFVSRKIADENFTSILADQIAADEFQVLLTADMLDEFGLEFYFEVSDISGDTKRSDNDYIYRPVPANGETIPMERFGGTLESYQIFSIPYLVTDNLIATIFDEKGAYDPVEWRLVRYQNNRNVDFGDGINRIELGKGYWFNQKERTTISFSEGNVPFVNQDEHYQLTLTSGWNQIGNPFLFDLKWSDILSFNNNPEEIGELKIYNAQQVQLVSDDDLRTWGGGFVHNDLGNTVNLSIPVNLRTITGGRKAAVDRVTGNDPSKSEWILPLTLVQSGKKYQQTSIGMHPKADFSKDWYDDIHPPEWGENLEFYTLHPEFFSPKFARDIVPKNKAYTWIMELFSHSNEPITMLWDNDAFLNKGTRLQLFDYQSGKMINMAQREAYTFTPSALNKFDIILGDGFLAENLVFDPYPNPFSDHVVFSVSVKDRSPLTVTILNVLGHSIAEIASGYFDAGVHSWNWDGEVNGSRIGGIYFVEIDMNGKKTVKRLILKP